jgi:hypothetical protein
MATVAELVTVLGIEVDATTLAVAAKVDEALNKIESIATKATIAFGAFGAAVSYALKTIAKDSESLVRLSQQTGVSTDYIQQMSFAVEQLGGESSSLKNDIIGLAKSMTSPIPGQFNETLLMLGISARTAGGQMRNVEDVISDIAARFRGKSSIEAMQWGSKLGLSMDTIRLLQQGRIGVQQLREQLKYIVPRETLDAAVKFNQAWKSTWTVTKALSTELAIGFMPALTKVFDRFNAWLKLNRDLIGLKLGQVIEGISKGCERFWAGLTKIVNIMKPYLKALADAFGMTGDLKQKTEQFVNLALWGLTILAALWAAHYAKIALVVAAAGLLVTTISEITGASTNETISGMFYAIAFAAAFAADAVKSLARVLTSIPAFALRLGSYGTAAAAGISTGVDKVKGVFGVKPNGDTENLWAYAEAMSQVSDELQAGIKASQSQPSFTSRYMNSQKNQTINNNQKLNFTFNGTDIKDPQSFGRIAGKELLSQMAIGGAAGITSGG